MKKTVCMVLMFVFAVSVWYVYAEMIKDNKERTYEAIQYFDNPIVEGNSKDGPWKNSPNAELQDPKNNVLFFDDFTEQRCSLTANANQWLADACGTVADAGPGGKFKIMESAADATMNMQLNGEAFQLQRDKPIYFETRLTPTGITYGNMCDWFVGLMSTDTEAMDDALTTQLGFISGTSSTASIYGVVKASGTQYLIDTGRDLSDSTAVRLGFSVDNSVSQSIKMYVNDDIVAKPCTNGVCTQFLGSSLPYAVSPAIGIQAERTDPTLGYIEVDYMKVIQKR